MTKSLRFLVAVTASLFVLATASFAAPTIDVASFGNGAAFTTDFAYGEAWLRVSGPEAYLQEVKLGSLDDLAFELDATAVDGSYKWELLAVQSIGPVLQAKLDQAAVSGDRGAIDRLKASGELQSATFYGTFQVRGGAVQLPTKSYSADDRDIQLKTNVINDDQVVIGSLCVGFDCDNNESFGSDTIRLKENNLRIHFNDTSSSASFPSNDWRIEINATTNGGDEYFAIQDSTAGNYPLRIEAGAGNNALYLEDGGNVGVGTSDPVVKFHVQDGNSPALRLHQDGSDGFQTQIWDLAGNETNFFVRDVSNGSLLPFKVLPSAPTNTLVLNSTGAGVGTNNNGARAPFHVRGGGANHDPSNSAVMALFQNNNADSDGSIISILAGNGSANAQMWFGDTDDDNAGRIIYRNGSDAMSFWANGQEYVFIEADGGVCFDCNDAQGAAIRHNNGATLSSGGTWTNASSRALKQDITELGASEAMSALHQLSPVTFRYKSEQAETYVGFIAEDVPELVAMNDRSGLTAMDVVAVLTKVVQEQQKAYEAQRDAFQAQEATVRALQSRLEALEGID